MTQALLNNLNINKNNNFYKNDKVENTDANNFEIVLNEKTNNTIADDETLTNNDTNNEFSTLIQETVIEAEAETIVDNISEDGVCEEVTENIQENNENTTDTDITNEDPTMQTNKTPLESSASLIYLHAQVTTNKSNLTTTDSENSILKTDNFTKETNDFHNITRSDKLLENTPQKTINLCLNDEQAEVQSTDKNRYLDTKILKSLNIESIKASSQQSGSTSDNYMKNETPQEQAIKIMIQSEGNNEENIVISDISALKNETAPNQTQNLQIKTNSLNNISSEKIIEQITKQLNNVQTGSKVNIILNPAAMGRIHLHLFNSKEGLTAQFTVTTQETRDLLMRGLDGLKESMLTQGINVENISVKYENPEESDYNDDWTEQGQSGYKNKEQQTKKEKEEKPFEQMMSEAEKNDKV